MSEDEILKQLSNAVLEGNPEKSIKAAQDALKAGIDPVKAIVDGLQKGMFVLGQKWEKFEVFLPEVLLGADAMKAAMGVLTPKLNKASAGKQGTIVIGTSWGDIHDIGKNMVSAFLEVSGFRVIDLGVDVAPNDFIKAAQENNADIIAISSLITSSMFYMEDVIKNLKDMGIRDKYYVIVGGGPTHPDFAEKIGADGWGMHAIDGVEVAKQLVKEGKKGASLVTVKE
jgi:corrinoid protein of di/trimethylamine methyltransferase